MVECPETETVLSGTVVVSFSVEGKNVRLSLLQQGLCTDTGMLCLFRMRFDSYDFKILT